jgi:hypothetical protein
MRSMSSSIIPTVVEVDRASTRTQDSPVVPADGDDSRSNVDGTYGTVRPSTGALQLSPPSIALGVPPSFKADGGASLEMSASEQSKPATPDLNWLIALGER